MREIYEWVRLLMVLLLLGVFAAVVIAVCVASSAVAVALLCRVGEVILRLWGY